jgi:hypothetical protein
VTAATRIDLKREFRDLYLPGRDPQLVEVPDMGFIMVDGRGDPNTSAAYREAIEALYAVAYTMKFAIKRRTNGIDFAVMPLESLWWSDESGPFPPKKKTRWSWTAMIVQHEAVSPALVEDAARTVAQKRSLPALELLRYERFAEGMAAQGMHVGPYREEGPTIATLRAFIVERGYVAAGKHHEIYLGDPRRPHRSA